MRAGFRGSYCCKGMCIRRSNILRTRSGETWIQSMTAYRQLNNAGVGPNAVQSNPSLVPNNPLSKACSRRSRISTSREVHPRITITGSMESMGEATWIFFTPWTASQVNSAAADDAAKDKPAEPATGGPVRWNFTKFVIGRDGKVAKRFEPDTETDDPELISAIERALALPAKK